MPNTESESRAQQEVAGPLSQKAGEEAGVTIAGEPERIVATATHERAPDGSWRRVYVGAWTPPPMTDAEFAAREKAQRTAAHEHSIAVNEWRKSEAARAEGAKAAKLRALEAEREWLKGHTVYKHYTYYPEGVGRRVTPGGTLVGDFINKPRQTHKEYTGERYREHAQRPVGTVEWLEIFPHIPRSDGSTVTHSVGYGTPAYLAIVRQNPDRPALRISTQAGTRAYAWYGKQTGAVKSVSAGEIHPEHAAYRRRARAVQLPPGKGAPRPVLAGPVVRKNPAGAAKAAKARARGPAWSHLGKATATRSHAASRPARTSAGSRPAKSAPAGYRNPRTSAAGLSIGGTKSMGLGMKGRRTLSLGGRKKRGLSL